MQCPLHVYVGLALPLSVPILLGRAADVALRGMPRDGAVAAGSLGTAIRISTICFVCLRMSS